MKKILLSLGAAASIIAPITTVIACASNKPDDKKFKVNVDQGTINFANSNTATEKELLKGTTKNMEDYFPVFSIVKVWEVNANNPTGPNSSMHYNYSGIIGIVNAFWEDMLGNPTRIEISKMTPEKQAKIQNAHVAIDNLLRDLLFNKTILTNNNDQNLNTQEIAQRVYENFKSPGLEAYTDGVTSPIDLGLIVKSGPNKNQKVQILIGVNGKVDLKFAPASN